MSHWENTWCWGQLLCSRTWNIYPAAGSMSGCYLTVVLFKQYFHHITYKGFQSIGLKYQAVLLLRRANNGIYPKPRYPIYTSFYIEYVSAKFHQNISFGRHDNIYINMLCITYSSNWFVKNYELHDKFSFSYSKDELDMNYGIYNIYDVYLIKTSIHLYDVVFVHTSIRPAICWWIFNMTAYLIQYHIRFVIPIDHQPCHDDWISSLWPNTTKTGFPYLHRCHFFFVVHSSYHKWCMCGCQNELCSILIDFDHWLHLSGIVKRATRSKPDVAVSLTCAVCIYDIETRQDRWLVDCSTVSAFWA